VAETMFMGSGINLGGATASVNVVQAKINALKSGGANPPWLAAPVKAKAGPPLEMKYHNRNKVLESSNRSMARPATTGQLSSSRTNLRVANSAPFGATCGAGSEMSAPLSRQPHKTVVQRFCYGKNDYLCNYRYRDSSLHTNPGCPRGKEKYLSNVHPGSEDITVGTRLGATPQVNREKYKKYIAARVSQDQQLIGDLEARLNKMLAHREVRAQQSAKKLAARQAEDVSFAASLEVGCPWLKMPDFIPTISDKSNLAGTASNFTSVVHSKYSGKRGFTQNAASSSSDFGLSFQSHPGEG
jgi:hypothetical protein